MKGFINIIKPSGITSAGVVNAVKRKFNIKCGHMGTLDPMASGILPVGLGKASRLFQYMLDKEKEYIANFKFGLLTDTLDTTGKVEKTTEFIPSKSQIIDALKYFIGNISQVPPKYSAKCISGKRGYQLARSGVEFELAPKIVNIIDFSFISQISEDEFSFKIRCKGGTYIRSLARDLGEKLGSLAIMSKLDRTTCGVFNYNNGIAYEDFINADNLDKYIIKPEDTISFGSIVLTEKQATKLINGVYEKGEYQDGIYKVFFKEEFLGVGTVIDGILKINSYIR